MKIVFVLAVQFMTMFWCVGTKVYDICIIWQGIIQTLFVFGHTFIFIRRYHLSLHGIRNNQHNNDNNFICIIAYKATIVNYNNSGNYVILIIVVHWITSRLSQPQILPIPAIQD